MPASYNSFVRLPQVTSDEARRVIEIDLLGRLLTP